MIKGSDGNWSVIYTIPQVFDGEYQVYLTASNSLGNRGIASIPFTVDNTPPALTAEVNPNYVEPTGQVQVWGESSEDARTVSATFGSQRTDLIGLGSSWFGFYTVPGATPLGTQTVDLEATDMVGNMGTLALLYNVVESAQANPNPGEIPGGSPSTPGGSIGGGTGGGTPTSTGGSGGSSGSSPGGSSGGTSGAGSGGSSGSGGQSGSGTGGSTDDSSFWDTLLLILLIIGIALIVLGLLMIIFPAFGALVIVGLAALWDVLTSLFLFLASPADESLVFIVGLLSEILLPLSPDLFGLFFLLLEMLGIGAAFIGLFTGSWLYLIISVSLLAIAIYGLIENYRKGDITGGIKEKAGETIYFFNRLKKWLGF